MMEYLFLIGLCFALGIFSAILSGGKFSLAILDSVVAFEGEDAGFFMKPVTENPLITDLGFELLDDAIVDQFIYLNGELDKITKLYAGCGAKTDTELGTTIFRKEIQPVKLEIYKTQCADVFDNTVFRKQLNRGVDAGNLTDAEINKLLLDFIEPVVVRDALRILMLGDTALSDPNYSMMDGFFKVLSTGVVSDGISDAGAITDSDLAVANIQATFERVRDARTRKLKQTEKGTQLIYCTDSVFDAWNDFLQTNSALESARQKLIDGIPVSTFEGYELRPIGLLDEYLEADFATGSPAVITGEHRMVWTNPTNHVLLLDTVSNYNLVKFGYDDRDEINWYKVRYMMAYDYKYPELITVAGF